MKNIVLSLTLMFGILINAQMKILINSLPENTQKEAKLYLASSLNQWNPKDDNFQFSRTTDGLHEINVDTKENFEFKITQGSWDFSEANSSGQSIENHKANINASNIINVNIDNWTTPQKKQHTLSSNVKILSENFNLPQLKTTRKIWIYLPPDYATSSQKYPVIYMHDGQNLFDNATSFSGEWGVDETMNQLSEQHKFSAIIVGIDNGGDSRLDEYSPWKNKKYNKGGEGEAYVEFLVKTLKPYIDKRYRTLPQAKNTGLIGSSMGGLISFYAGVKYPKTFGKIGIFSPAFWFVSKDLQLFTNQNNKHLKNSKFYFVAGAHEDEGLTKEIDTIENILLKSVPKDNISTKIDEDGTHSENYWRREFSNAVLWLFGN